jgi:prevent-host-death family protein
MTYFSISTVDAKETLTDLVNQVFHNKERVILTRRGKEIAALVPIEDLELIQTSQNTSDLQEAIESLKEARAQGTITLEDLKNEVS